MSTLYAVMVFSSVLLTAIGLGLITTAWQSYNRCKSQSVNKELAQAIHVLDKLQRRHESYHDGMGPCICDSHVEARLIVNQYNRTRGKQ